VQQAEVGKGVLRFLVGRVFKQAGELLVAELLGVERSMAWTGGPSSIGQVGLSMS